MNTSIESNHKLGDDKKETMIDWGMYQRIIRKLKYFFFLIGN